MSTLNNFPANGDYRIARRSFLTTMLAVIGGAVGGCRTAVNTPVALPARHSVRSQQLLVLSDFRLENDHPLIHDLERLRQTVVRELELPFNEEQVTVYLFSEETDYQKFLQGAYPGLPSRRAYFVGTPSELAVYTFWGERVGEDLRHEFTHGLLHAGLKNVPLWLDEGLAEYFETTDAEPDAVKSDYARRLSNSVSNGWRPNLERLEKLNAVAQMQAHDYQEAWAWVHFLLHGTQESKHVLLEYLEKLQTDSRPEPLSTLLTQDVDDVEARLINHIASLSGPGAWTTGPQNVQSALGDSFEG